MLKEYVKLFQTSAPITHLVHDRLETLFHDFLSCCVKPEVIIGKSSALLVKINIENNVCVS